MKPLTHNTRAKAKKPGRYRSVEEAVQQKQSECCFAGPNDPADAHPFWLVSLIPICPGLIADSYILQLGVD